MIRMHKLLELYNEADRNLQETLSSIKELRDDRNSEEGHVISCARKDHRQTIKVLVKLYDKQKADVTKILSLEVTTDGEADAIINRLEQLNA